MRGCLKRCPRGSGQTSLWAGKSLGWILSAGSSGGMYQQVSGTGKREPLLGMRIPGPLPPGAWLPAGWCPGGSDERETRWPSPPGQAHAQCFQPTYYDAESCRRLPSARSARSTGFWEYEGSGHEGRRKGWSCRERCKKRYGGSSSLSPPRTHTHTVMNPLSPEHQHMRTHRHSLMNELFWL